MDLAGEETALPTSQTASSRRRRWLKGPALALAAAIVAAGCWDYSARRQKRAVGSVAALGGKVSYADEMPFQQPNAAARWLQDKLGHDYTSSVAVVRLSGADVRDEDLTCLRGLPGLQALLLNNTAVGDVAVKELSHIPRLEELSLRTTRITDAGLSHLARLQRLEFLYLQDNEISDAGLANLESLTSLKLLKLDGTRVTARGIRKLQRALPLTQISR